MRSLNLLLTLTMTFSVTAWAQMRTADVDIAYAPTTTSPKWKPAKGHAQVAGEDDARVLQFQVNGKVTDTIDLDHGLMGAFGKIESLKIIRFTDYGARATAEGRRSLLNKSMPEIYFFKPLVVLQEDGKTHLYTVDQEGQLTHVFESALHDASLLRAGLKDRDGVLEHIDMDLIKIGSGKTMVYYSPELKSVVNENQIVMTKMDHNENELSMQELLSLRAISPATADRYEAAEKALRESRYIFTSPAERKDTLMTLSQLVLASEPSDALIARRVRARNLALQGQVIAQSKKFSLLKETGAEFRSAVAAARLLLSGKGDACPKRLTKQLH